MLYLQTFFFGFFPCVDLGALQVFQRIAKGAGKKGAALSVPKNRNRRKIAAFSNRKVLNRRLCRRNRRKIARKSQKKS